MLPPSLLQALSHQRFIFVTGKGGVGKSTVTALLARGLAAEGRRVLVTACTRKERLSRLLDTAELTNQVQPLAKGIDGVLLEPRTAIREYGQLILGKRPVYGKVFDNKYVETFFNAVPGLSEWALLGKAWYHSVEEDKRGRPRYDVVLFDAPATGHGLDMLRVPKVILDIVPPGVLRRDAELAWQMFQDPQRSGVVVVTLAEELPTNETVELVASLQDDLKLPVPALVVNGVRAQLLSEDERGELLALGELPREPVGMAGVAAGVRRAIRERVQSENLQRLRSLALPTVELPFLWGDAARPQRIVRELLQAQESAV